MKSKSSIRYNDVDRPALKVGGVPGPIGVMLAIASRCLILLTGVFIGVFTGAQPIVPPTSTDPAVHVSLFAAEPQIVTPIGATVDSRGRLLVIESHSHFRPKEYKGPATDRIRIFQDSNGGGRADRIETFFEGMNFLMNLVTDRDGSILVSSRNEIFRLADADGVAGTKTTLAHLETKADYPHNGLHGLAIDREGNVYFGIGENLGGPWTLVGTDGRTLSDDTGSGSVFRVDAQGRGLIRIARGFWNPFGLGVDPAGTLWAVDNDPDGRPPCRLIDVAPGADYGFEFRYGRTGMHPLQAWDGELPGTLGMVAGVGEGPCAVLWNRGRLLVSSWRDHVIQSFSLVPRGASYTAKMQPLILGGENFRPVALAPAADGAVYVTDWSSSSYPLHGKGRIWKVTFDGKAGAGDVPIGEARVRAARLRESSNVAELVAALDDVDPAMAQAAQFGLSRLADVDSIEWGSLKPARQRIGVMAARLLRGSDQTAFVAAALGDPDDRVRQMAVRVIAERQMTGSREALQKLLGAEGLSPRLLGMIVATIGQLEGDKAARVDPAKISAVLLGRLNDARATDETRAATLRLLHINHPRIPPEQLGAMLRSSSVGLQLEVVRYLNGDSDAGRFELLAQVAGDAKCDLAVRCEAVDGLADDATARVDVLMQLAGDASPLRQEALRSLRPVAAKLSEVRRNQLAELSRKHPEDRELADRLLDRPPAARPVETDLAAWERLLDATPGDPAAGRRVFFHPSGPGCYRCHVLEGRGRAIGPDLTMIGHSQTRQHVLESILEPSKEIAPLFTLWTITTKSGQKIDGMLLRRDGQQKEVYVDSAGVEIKVAEPDVVDRKVRSESVMPSGLAAGMTEQELRDVMAVLLQKR
jgi:putative membrane-bound dehydrogenase-like protein